MARRKGAKNRPKGPVPWRNYRCRHYGPCLNFCAANDCQLACGRCRHSDDRTFEELSGIEIFGFLRLRYFIETGTVFEPDGIDPKRSKKLLRAKANGDNVNAVVNLLATH